MIISIICPIYNGQEYIKNLHNNILKQELNEGYSVEILYALTRCSDKSEEILKSLKCDYTLIEPKDF
ncbi:MAG: rhamnosyltransferase, partial [Clostridioides difficile]|nr:rhamnosyltransferase [Clostridioides difficile]